MELARAARLMEVVKANGILLAVLASAACGMPFWKSPPPPSTPWTPPPLSDQHAAPADVTERGVHQWLLDHVSGKSRVLLVQDSTLQPLFWSGSKVGGDSFVDSLAHADSALVANYREGLRTRVPFIAEGLATMVPVVLVGDSVLGARDWRPLYRRHRGASGILAVSRVGFNADSTRALVLLQTLCAPAMCGGRERFFLARAPGRAWTLWRADWIVYY